MHLSRQKDSKERRRNVREEVKRLVWCHVFDVNQWCDDGPAQKWPFDCFLIFMGRQFLEGFFFYYYYFNVCILSARISRPEINNLVSFQKPEKI